MSQPSAAIPRRNFLKAATTGVAALSSVPAILGQRSPNDVIGIACIGVGTQGHRLMQWAQDVPGTEIRIICDLYEGNIRRAQKLCKNPKVRIVREWERAVEDPDIDAVIIATPDFWHAPMVIRAAQARKDIYVEKGWCRFLWEAQQMRKAVKENHVVMQLGHHYNSSPYYHKAREIYRSGQLGKVTLVRMYIDRTGPSPFWKFYTDYSVTQMPADASPETIDWERFIANTRPHPFNAERFFTWRCWWDYGTGAAGDLMSHMWDGVNMILGMGIPETAITQGGIYFWKGDRDVPDVWNVVFDYPTQELALVFSCCFHNQYTGETTLIYGREKTLEVGERHCRVYPADWLPEQRERLAELRRQARQRGDDPQAVKLPPEYVMKPGELQVSSHMENFLECVRTRQEPRCGVDRAFEEAVAIVMSVESYFQGRKVRWDPERERIV